MSNLTRFRRFDLLRVRLPFESSPLSMGSDLEMPISDLRLTLARIPFDGDFDSSSGVLVSSALRSNDDVESASTEPAAGEAVGAC